MSHFGRSGPPDIKDTYSLLVLNITFRTSADDLFPLFEKYGNVVDVFIPRDKRAITKRTLLSVIAISMSNSGVHSDSTWKCEKSSRTGDSRGFAIVRYKYADEAQKAVDRLDGRVVDGREIMVRFAKYGPNAERIKEGRILEPVSRSRSRSPRPSHRDEYKDKEYRRRSRSRSRDRYDRRRSRSRSRSRSPRSDRGKDKYDDERKNQSRSYGRTSPARRSRSPRKNTSPRRTPSPGGKSPILRNKKEQSPTPKSVSLRAGSQSRSPRSDADD